MLILKEEQLQEILETEKYFESREQYVKRMQEEGFKMHYPEDNELLLDIDSKRSLDLFKTKFKRFNEEIMLCGEEATYEIKDSKTEGHKHIIIKLPFKIETMERIALQAVLGSDLVREMLSIFRYWRDDPYPTLLARKEKS